MTKSDAIKALKDHKICFEHDFGWNQTVLEALDLAIQALDATDVVPVVRCKDCRKGIPDSEYATAYSCYGIWHKPDWFCAGGVRKDGDGD